MKLNVYNPDFSSGISVVCRNVWIAIFSNFLYALVILCNCGCHLHTVMPDNTEILSLKSSHNTLITLSSCKESCVYRGANKSLSRPGRKQATATSHSKKKKKFRTSSVQTDLRGSSDLRVGPKMATLQLFFQSGRAKDLSAPLCCSVILILRLYVVSPRICKFTECHHMGTDIVYLSEIVLFISSRYRKLIFILVHWICTVYRIFLRA